MAYAMTKQGSRDNVITYEFMCDTLADMNAIESEYRTLGSIAIVLQGESEALEVYICDSTRQWIVLNAGGSSNPETGGGGSLSIYICAQNEVDNGLPDIAEPDENTIYLVPAGETSGNLYEEYIYVDEAWEKFGAATIDLSNYATKSEISGFYTKPNGGIPAADLAETYLTAHQDLSNYVQKTDYATYDNPGIVAINATSYGIGLSNEHELFIREAALSHIKNGSISYSPIVPKHQHEAVFYGLAKAAGDSTQAASDNAVGTYTAGAKAAIQSMLGLGVASSSDFGLVKVDTGLGIGIDGTSNKLFIDDASDTQIKPGTEAYKPITPRAQHTAVFYGLAKAAGDSTQAASNNAVGIYTDNAKLAINNMLGTVPMSYIDDFIENEEGIKVYEFEDVESTSTTGEYIDFNGSIATSSSFSHTAPIQVHQSDIVYVTAQGYTNNIAMIAWGETNNESSFAPLVVSDDSTTKEYSTFIPEDGYITCSYKTSEEITITIKRQFSNDALNQRTEFIEEAMPNLMSFMENADFNMLTNQTEATINQNGKYIDKNGNVQTSNNYMYTNAIALPANSTILFGAQGYLTNVALLAKDNGDSTYTPLVVSADNNPHSFTYHTKSAVNVVISTNKYVVPTYMIFQSKLDKAVLDTDYATSERAGIIKIAASGTGLYCHPTTGELSVAKASSAAIKNGTNQYSPIVPLNQHEAVFYGLATAAGDSTQKASNNAVGTYTDNAKVAIRDMLGVQDNFTRNSINRIVPFGTSAIDGTEKTTTLYIKSLQEGAAQLVIGSNVTNINLTKSTANDKIYYTSTETVQDGVTPILTLYHDSSATVSATVTYQIASDTTYSGQQEIALYYPAYIVSTHGVAAFITSAKTGYATKLVSTDDIATDSTPGVVKVNAGHGIAIDSDGVLQLTTPTTNQLQALSNGWLAPRLNTMHTATFYSLAKAAGDTTQSISTNAVGVYTDNAKVSIQKMIGTYEAPWELIRDDTFTNDTMAQYIISTDDNNDPFELTDCYLWIIIPSTDQAGDYGLGNYGRIRFLTSNENLYFDALLAETNNPASSKVGGAWLTQSHGAIHIETLNLTDSGNTGTIRRFATNNYDSQLAPLIIPLVYPRIITGVKISAAQGTIKYRLYGRRKWQN